jgi:hypothetical protein
MLSCAYHFKVKACLILHADPGFVHTSFFFRMGLLKHMYYPILVLRVKRILFFTNGLSETGTT